MRPRRVIRSAGAAGLAAAAAVGLYAPPAFAAATNGTQTGTIPAGYPWPLGPSPSGLPSSCPFANDFANFAFLSGTYVSHGTVNNNGDWGGFTAEGPAVFYEDVTQIAEGHLTVWFGGGNNSSVRGQNEGGITVDFTGAGPTGSVQIHVNEHMTTPANSPTGLPTAAVLNVTVTCA